MKRLIKYLWVKFKALMKWLWHQLKDWHTLVLFIGVCIVMSSEIWVLYILGFIAGPTTEKGAWLIGIASSCWAFWLMPFTPFLELCIAITFGIKAIHEKLKKHKIRRRQRMTKKERFLKVFDDLGTALRFEVRYEDKTTAWFILKGDDLLKAKAHFEAVMTDDLFIKDLSGTLINAEMVYEESEEQAPLSEILRPENKVNNT